MNEPVYSIPKTQTGQEILERGTPLFPCAVYDRDIRHYIGGEIPPHWHHEMEIFLLQEGSAHISLADSGFDLRAGEGYFVNSDVLHGVSSPPGQPCRYRSIVFDPCILSGVPGSAFDILYLKPFAEQGGRAFSFRKNDGDAGDEIARLFRAAFQNCETEKSGYEFLVRDALSRIFLLLRDLSPLAKARPQNGREIRLKRMLAWLDEHYMEPVTVSQLAECSGICVRECQRIFSSLLHTTPVQYLNRRRVAVAAEFLVSTDMPVIEVGLCCGFQNPGYFAKQFKRLTGMTPGEYRKNDWDSGGNGI